LLGGACVLAATAEFWLGTHYRLDDREAWSRTGFAVTALPWDEVKRVTIEADSIRLSPLETSSRMDAFRGVRLRTDAELHARVVAYVKQACGNHVRFLGDGSNGGGTEPSAG
jgi:hypothetical protein